MTKHEAAYLASFMEELVNRLGNDSCSELPLADTPQNRELAREAYAHCTGEPDQELTCSEGKVRTNNTIILGYLQYLFMAEYGITEEDMKANPVTYY